MHSNAMRQWHLRTFCSNYASIRGQRRSTYGSSLVSCSNMIEEARMDEEKGRVLPFDCRTNCIRLGFLTAQVESAVRCPILCARLAL
jgi:hypothetical protein